MLANFSGEKLTISKATVLGVAEEVSESLIASMPESDLGRRCKAKYRRC
jgi:hypothetical protein